METAREFKTSDMDEFMDNFTKLDFEAKLKHYEAVIKVFQARYKTRWEFHFDNFCKLNMVNMNDNKKQK